MSNDLAALSAGLGRALRAAGLPVTHERSARFAEAVGLVRPLTRSELYWTARTVFVSSEAQLATFDRVFDAVFDPRLADEAERGDPGSPTRSRTDGPAPDRRKRTVPRDPGSAPGGSFAAAPLSRGESEATEIEVPIALASDEERLQTKSFDALEPAELARLRALMTELELATPRRRARRARAARRGERFDLRRTLRAGMRTGGDPITIARRRRRTRARRLVLLCDISGSMEPYARAYLQLLSSAVASDTPAEAFVFATRLTRITRPLSGHNPDAAIRRAAEAAPDWSSGTRIGQALKTFNDRYGRRGLARGAVVVILSDGWERGDPALVGREMERLARLAHRIVWVNPRAAAPGFEPRAGGMAAALPRCDALVSGHSLEALDELLAAIRRTHVAVPAARWRSGVEEEPDWASAEPTAAQQPVPMPSGYGPKRGNTTP